MVEVIRAIKGTTIDIKATEGTRAKAVIEVDIKDTTIAIKAIDLHRHLSISRATITTVKEEGEMGTDGVATMEIGGVAIPTGTAVAAVEVLATERDARRRRSMYEASSARSESSNCLDMQASCCVHAASLKSVTRLLEGFPQTLNVQCPNDGRFTLYHSFNL